MWSTSWPTGFPCERARADTGGSTVSAYPAGLGLGRRLARLYVGLLACLPLPALRRLRDLLDDELFLRTPAGMEPTPYAQQLAGPVAQALDTLRDALNVRASFDPSTSTRRFTLALTDVGEIYFLPVLMDALAREAPGVKLLCVPVGTPTLRDDMASGRVDLALGLLPQLQAGFYQQALFRQRYVALMNATHPLARHSTLSAAAYQRAAHVRNAGREIERGRAGRQDPGEGGDARVGGAGGIEHQDGLAGADGGVVAAGAAPDDDDVVLGHGPEFLWMKFALHMAKDRPGSEA